MLMFDRAIRPASGGGGLPFDWPFLRLLRSGSPSWVPEFHAPFLASTARQSIKQWICFVCHSVHLQSYDLCSHLENQHPQLNRIFSMNPQLFPRCTNCREYFWFCYFFLSINWRF
jgi:hypothetical protein